MKKTFILTMLMAVCLQIFSQTAMTYNIDSKISDYEFKAYDTFTRVHTTRKNFFYSNDITQPEIPYTNIKLLLPRNSRVSDVEVTSTGKLLVGKYTLPSNAPRLNRYDKQTICIKYDVKKQYPESNLIGYSQSSIDGYEVLYASVCPFEYNASTGELFLLTGLKLNYKIKERNNRTTSHIGHNMRNIVHHIVENADVLENLYPESENYQFGNQNYLIITADSLKSAFESLAMTKPYKGMMVNIVSIEEIVQQYNLNAYAGLDIVEKIKYYIHNKYNNDNVGYVLLGGNCDIIPTRYCYGYVDGRDVSIPTDWYYACVSSDSEYDLRWDYNRNHIYGEPCDRMDLRADLFVSRLPIANRKELESYLHKRIKYELDEQYNDNSYNNLLLAGRVVGVAYDISDAQYWGTHIGNMIQNYFNADLSYLYDTYSTVQNEEFSANALQQQLQNENAFVHIDTHGESSKLLTGVNLQYYLNPDEFYTSDSVMHINSAGNTIITTSACFSNDYDTPNSLGRTFMLNQDNGTLFFVGNSYKGAVPIDTIMGYEPQIYYDMYESLFSGQVNNFEECLFLAKNDFSDSDANVLNWLLYTINPIGDPDFTPYLYKPNMLNADVELVSGWINVYTGLDDCSLNQYGEENGGFVDRQLFDYSYCAPGQYTDNIRFGVYKSGWIPYIASRDYCRNLYIQDFRDVSLVAKGQYIFIGRDVAAESPENYNEYGSVEINSGRSLDLEVGHELTITKDFVVELGGTLNIRPKY